MLWSGLLRGESRGAARGRWAHWAVCLACVSAAAGCDLNGLEDISDSLLDPDKALLDHPGRQLVIGHYSGLKIAGSAEGGGYVLARRHDVPVPSVAVVPFLEGKPCEYSPAFDYDRFSSRIDLELPGTLSVQVDQNSSNGAYGTVRFIDYDCQEVIDEVPDTVLPGPLFPGVDPFGMLARSSDGTLYVIDAKRRTSTVVAPLVDYGVVAGSFLFTLESGEVVIRDEDLEEVERLGDGVTALIATGGDLLTLAYQDTSGMYGWNEEDGPKLLGEDACRPSFLGQDAVAYYDPCDERRLAVRAPGESVFGGQSGGLVTLRGPYSASVESLTMTPGSSSGPSSLSELLIVTPPDAALPSGDLLGLTVPDDVSPEEAEVQLQAVVLAHGVTYVPNQGVYYKDYAESRGTLLDLERNAAGDLSGVLELAEDVTWLPYGSPYSYRGVLAGYDGERGNLVRLTRGKDDTIDRELLGEGIPMQAFVGDNETDLVAYVSEVDEDGLGILTIVDELGPLQVAENVLIGEVRLLEDPRGVVFLRPNGDAGSFELHTWLIEAELDLVIHEAASEYIPIPWPSPGVLYAVPEGDDAGLWFAKAR